MSIREWPQQERPREKAELGGLKAFRCWELLAIFLRTGIAGSSGNNNPGPPTLASLAPCAEFLSRKNGFFCQQVGQSGQVCSAAGRRPGIITPDTCWKLSAVKCTLPAPLSRRYKHLFGVGSQMKCFYACLTQHPDWHRKTRLKAR